MILLDKPKIGEDAPPLFPGYSTPTRREMCELSRYIFTEFKNILSFPMNNARWFCLFLDHRKKTARPNQQLPVRVEEAGSCRFRKTGKYTFYFIHCFMLGAGYAPLISKSKSRHGGGLLCPSWVVSLSHGDSYLKRVVFKF